jgi:hypothetical protein
MGRREEEGARERQLLERVRDSCYRNALGRIVYFENGS